MKYYAVCATASGLIAACDGGAAPARSDAAPVPVGALTRAQLRDPETCKDCHPKHYREWSSSMHAYAAQDPVFVAMNERGQRETHGELGNFCVKCHAPMAVLDQLTTDGLNLDELPDKARGVSCYFCHNAVSVDGDHNAMLQLANDTSMRGEIQDPLQLGAHRAQYSKLFEDTSHESTAMCGGCHDIVTRSGVHLERTLQEYQSGLFAKSATADGPAFESCAGCHMPGESQLAAVQGVRKRIVHEHLWPGVDVPLGEFPGREALRSAIEDCQLGPASVGYFTLELGSPDLFTLEVETNAGHNQPSGAAQDRRMWIELEAYAASGALLPDLSSGNIDDGEIEERPQADAKRDPQLRMLRDRIYDAQGAPVNMFWQAAKSSEHPSGYESSVLPVRTTMLDAGTHALQAEYRGRGADGLPARVTARLRMRPIGMDVLQDLVASGDLDPALLAQMPTFTFAAQIEWTPADGVKVISAEPKADCSTYRCMLDPGSQYCD